MDRINKALAPYGIQVACADDLTEHLGNAIPLTEMWTIAVRAAAGEQVAVRNVIPSGDALTPAERSVIDMGFEWGLWVDEGDERDIDLSDYFSRAIGEGESVELWEFYDFLRGVG